MKVILTLQFPPLISQFLAIFLLLRKDSNVHMHGLEVYVHEHHLLAREHSLESLHHTYMCLCLSLFNSVSYIFFFYHSPSSHD